MSKSRIIVTGFDPDGPFSGLLLPWQLRKRQKETRFKQEWKLTIGQYMAMLAAPFKGPKRQRGNFAMFPAGTTALGIDLTGNVVLTAHSFIATAPLGTALSGVSFRSDGTLRERDDPGTDVDVTGEWWDNEPVVGIGSYYEVRALSTGKTGTWSASAAADDVWITMNSNREWNVTKGSPNGSKICTATFEVGPDGVETADDSAAITCEAEFNDA